MFLQSINFLHLTASEIQPGQDFIGQGHYTKVKVKSRSYHDNAHLQPPNQCPYQVSTCYNLQFLRYRSEKLFPTACPPIQTPWVKTILDFIGQGDHSKDKSRSHHDFTNLHPNQCPYQLSTSYNLQFLRYRLEKLFPAARLPNRTPWVKTIPQQPLRAVG